MNKQQRTRNLATAAAGMVLGVLSVLGVTAVAALADDQVAQASAAPVACGNAVPDVERPLQTLWSGRTAYSAE